LHNRIGLGKCEGVFDGLGARAVYGEDVGRGEGKKQTYPSFVKEYCKA